MLPCIQSVMLLAKTWFLFCFGRRGTFNTFISSMNCVPQPLLLLQLLTEWIG